jgi:hypothetical protein
MGDRVHVVPLEGGNLHLGAVETPQHVSRLAPPGAEMDLSGRQHLDLLDAGDVRRSVLDVREHPEDVIDRRRDATGNGDSGHRIAP